MTGTVAARRGYQACKGLLLRKDAGPARLYVDEIGRASRDAIEALSLGRLVDGLGLRMLGVADNFDSAMPDSKHKLHLYAMLQEWFVDQLRSKVHRGMTDAFLSGANLYAACLGYTLVPKTDADGNPVLDREGRPEMTRAIDPEGAAWVRAAYDLFVVRGWNRSKIALHFNEHAAAGVRTWDASRVLQLLEREVYKGVEYYPKTRQRRDPVTGKVTTVRIPKAKQLFREVPHLRLVSDEVWDLARAKIVRTKAVRTRNRDRPRKSEVYPKTLLRPVCGHCEEPLILGRSGRYASFCCLNGRDGKKGCPLKSYKSVRVIEEAVLGHLKEHVLTDAFVDRLLAEANASLAAAASEPPADTAPLEAELRRKEAAVRRIAARLERVEDAGRLDAAFAELARLEGRA
ncbi:MAG TPA: recombinase family protein, partial [Planctomycetaceae bacterium]